jgi:hypothetical protein
MRKLIVCLLVALLFCTTAHAKKKAPKKPTENPTANWRETLPDKEGVAQYLQDISVTVNVGRGEGSGVIKTVTMKRNGKDVKVNFVWTAAHVVDTLRSVERVIDPKSGTERVVVKFDDADIIKELVEGGRKVGELKMQAEVVRYNEKEDLALLRIRKTNFVSASVVFYQDKKIPCIGTDVFHVGSLLGQMGSNSMTSGIISQVGRVLDDGKVEYDQTTATSFPGSSGGGVYTKDGAYVGMIVRGAGEGFNLTVPVRRMVRWAKKAGILWALDDNVPPPTEEELEDLPIEDSGHVFTPSGSNADEDEREYKTLFRVLE